MTEKQKLEYYKSKSYVLTEKIEYLLRILKENGNYNTNLDVNIAYDNVKDYMHSIKLNEDTPKEFTLKQFERMNFTKNLALEEFDVCNEVDSTLLGGCVKSNLGEWRELTDNELDIISDNFSEYVWECSHDL